MKIIKQKKSIKSKLSILIEEKPQDGESMMIEAQESSANFALPDDSEDDDDDDGVEDAMYERI